jgi:hypothetical protein
MRHRVRHSWHEWEKIGASVQILQWVWEGVSIPFDDNRPPPRFNQGVTLLDATPTRTRSSTVNALSQYRGLGSLYMQRLRFQTLYSEQARQQLVEANLRRPFNEHCVRKRLNMETLLRVKHLMRKGDYMFSFDLHDGFYALGISPADRDYFTVSVRRHLYRLTGLPMGWSLSPFYFGKMTLTSVDFQRASGPKQPIATHGNFTKTLPIRTRLRGAMILPYVDDLLLFASIEEEALTLRQRLGRLLDRLGLPRHPIKGFWAPTQAGHHLGINIDTAAGYFYAPESKLAKIAQHVRQLIGRVTRNVRLLPIKDLQSLAGHTHYLFLTIPAARFYLRQLHSVVGEKWGGLVRLTPHLHRDLQW